VALAWFGGRASGYWLAIHSMVLIAGLQNHLLILLHEGAHVLLHPNRRVNDLIADLFCAIPFFTLEKNYRIFHLTHHKYASSPEKDPEVLFYGDQGYFYAKRPFKEALKMLFLDFFGWSLVRFSTSMAKFLRRQRTEGKLEKPNPKDILLSMAIWGSVSFLAYRFNLWLDVFLFWVLPQISFMFFFLKLHGYGEHTGATGPTEFERTWVHAFSPITDFFIYPIYSGYHLEHHLFPRVPWYHMAAFRRGLLGNQDYAIRAEKVTVDGYFFGKRTMFASMICGEGEYRVEALGAQTVELSGDIISSDTREEVDSQLRLGDKINA
jgi:fatty acid desaturase